MKKHTRTLWLSAIITIGFTLSVTGCNTPTNSGHSGPAVVSIAAIPGLPPPAAGAAPATAVETAQYTGAVAWEPGHAAFAEGEIYTATITLTAKSGFTLQGVAANFFTVAGATATNAANSGTVTAVFPATPGEPGGPGEQFTITFTQLQNQAPAITGPSIKLVGTAQEISGTITVTDADGYESIHWLFNGAPITAEHPVLGVTVNADNSLVITTGTAAASAFNRVGNYYITVEAVKDGRRYSAVITVTVTL